MLTFLRRNSDWAALAERIGLQYRPVNDMTTGQLAPTLRHLQETKLQRREDNARTNRRCDLLDVQRGRMLYVPSPNVMGMVG